MKCPPVFRRIQQCPIWIMLACLVVIMHLATAQADRLHDLQAAAEQSNTAAWGHWGTSPEVYFGSNSHSNRLIPIYTFGTTLSKYTGEKSVYRSADGLREIYGYVPDHTVNPQADYCDQSDIYRLQKDAVAAGKKYIFLIIFDGMDWDLTRTAAHYYHPESSYKEGRGQGLGFLDYQAPIGDYGFCVTSPTNTQAKVDVNTQQVENAAIGVQGGYDPSLGGSTPWSQPVDLSYLLGRNKERPHGVADSSCTAAALTTGKKSYNGAMNIDSLGRQSKPIAVELQEQGWRAGAVTSVPVSHATPGCAYCNNVTRSDYQDITRDMVGVKSCSHPTEPLRGLDVVIGTGWGQEAKVDSGQGTNFLPGNQYAHESTITEIDVANGGKYQVVQRTANINGTELLLSAAKEAAVKNRRLFGFFGTGVGNLPFATADGKFDPYVDTAAAKPRIFSVKEPYSESELNENPTLADMTRAAIICLTAEPQTPFWLMVEAGDVDWAAHNDNIDNAIGAVKSGDAAFQVIVDWIDEHKAWDDSAVIITSDHGHLFVPTNLEEIKP